MNTKHEKKQKAKHIKQAACANITPAPIGTKIVIGNLPDNITDKNIKELLLRPLPAPDAASSSQFLTSIIENPIKNHHIKSIKIATDVVTKKCRGFCHVEFVDVDSTKVALSLHKKASILDSVITVKIPKEKADEVAIEKANANIDVTVDGKKKRKRSD